MTRRIPARLAILAVAARVCGPPGQPGGGWLALYGAVHPLPQPQPAIEHWRYACTVSALIVRIC